jgi:hypothetical protein
MHAPGASGDYFLLFNRSGAAAFDVKVRGKHVQLDGLGKGYVRRIPVVPRDQPVRISLRGVGMPDPELYLIWRTSADSGGITWSTDLADYL